MIRCLVNSLPNLFGIDVSVCRTLERSQDMTSLLDPCEDWDRLEAEHLDWLSAFDPQHRRDWQKPLNGDREAALCEAAVRRLLQEKQITVQPNADLVGIGQNRAERRPDLDSMRVLPGNCPAAPDWRVARLAEDD